MIALFRVLKTVVLSLGVGAALVPLCGYRGFGRLQLGDVRRLEQLEKEADWRINSSVSSAAAFSSALLARRS